MRPNKKRKHALLGRDWGWKTTKESENRKTVLDRRKITQENEVIRSEEEFKEVGVSVLCWMPSGPWDS